VGEVVNAGSRPRLWRMVFALHDLGKLAAALALGLEVN
jgi:hypothetical protein